MLLGSRARSHTPARLPGTASFARAFRSKCLRLPQLTLRTLETLVEREPLSIGPRHRGYIARKEVTGAVRGADTPRREPACHGFGILQRRPVRWGRDLGDRAWGAEQLLCEAWPLSPSRAREGRPRRRSFPRLGPPWTVKRCAKSPPNRCGPEVRTLEKGF